MTRKGYEYPTLEQLWFLAPVPCVDPAYGLRYDPAELERDQVMHWYRVVPDPMTGQPMIRKMKVEKWDANHCKRKNGRSPRVKPQYRRTLKLRHRGENIHLYCAHLTLYCKTGYRPDDRRHNVAMHLNDISTDDRASNLRWGTQKENCQMSLKRRKGRKKL